jgi:hypothetical protein
VNDSVFQRAAMVLLFVLALSALMLPGRALAQSGEAVTVERESALRAEPSLSGQQVAVVRVGTRGEAIGKRGAWINIRTPDATGWVFMFNVRFGERQADASGSLAGAGRLVSARPTTNVTSTIGIRGLSEEDLQKAAFDGAELQRLDRFAVSRSDGEAAARSRRLEAVRVDPIDGGSR